MESNKRIKRADISSESSRWESMIQSANDLGDCHDIKDNLERLVEKTQKRIQGLKEAAKAEGLSYDGENAVECVCGNTIDQGGGFAGTCYNRTENGSENGSDGEKGGSDNKKMHEKEIFCIDCLKNCHSCEASFCEECAEECGYCNRTVCKEKGGSECTIQCHRCSEDFCKDDCIVLVGYGGYPFCKSCNEPEW